MPDDRATYFVVWTVKREGVILPEERLPAGPTVLVGLQHVVAMFGATVLAPLLMGFDPNVAIFFSGIGWSTIAAVVLADIGIVCVGTLLAAVATVSRARELLLPLLFLPLAIPVVIGGVGASVVSDPARYLGFLCLYDAVFAIISWASFEYVVTE